MQNHIRLDDLLSRDVNVQWFEGVALVQSVCRHILAAGPVNQPFPSPSNIHLCHDGSVLVLGASNGDGVGKAINVLALMLSDDVPVRLRLVVTQATGAETSYASLAEFSEALSYFERPDAQQVLRQLYERAAQTASRESRPRPIDTTAAPPAVPVAVPLPAASKGISRAAVLAATVAAGLCVMVALIGFDVDTRIATLLDTLQARFGPPAENAAPEASGATNEPAGKPRTGKSTGPTRTDPSADTDRATSAGDARRAHTPFVSAPELALLHRPFRHASDIAASFAVLNPSPLVFQDLEPVVVFASTRGAHGSEIDGRVYSKADSQVTLPRNIYPKLPAEPPNVPDRDGRTILELLIATDGLVERVHLRTPPRDVHEFMLVSAAKAWRFEPATVDGRPVRFLHHVALSSMP